MSPATILLQTLALAAFQSVGAATLSDETLTQIRFAQKLNAAVSPSLQFRDESGAQVRLGDYLGTKPVILVLGYYQCPMLCSLVLNGMVESLEDLKWDIGNQFEVINLSINPRETPALASAKKRTYLKRYGRAAAAQGWHFLTGDAAAIQQLAGEVGFQFAYDQASGQYAHPSGLVILTPQGKISRYLFGVTFSPRDAFSALEAASREKVSSPIRDLVLLCFHYNPIRGKYGPLILNIIRLLGVATVLALAWLILASNHSVVGQASEPAGPRGFPAPSSSPPSEPIPKQVP